MNRIDLGLEHLVKYLEIIIDFEPVIERTKIHLVSNPYFEPYNSFKEIDKELTGFTTQKDFCVFLQENGIICEPNSIKNFFRQYSTHSDDKLFVGDFLKFVLPSSKISLREDALRRQTGALTTDLKHSFLNVFRAELDMWGRLEEVKNDIFVHQISIPHLFAELDIPRGGFLTVDKFHRFLEKTGRTYSEPEIHSIILRLDTDGDFMISFEEFSQALSRPNSELAEFKSSKTSLNQKSQNSSNESSPKEWICGYLKLILNTQEALEFEKKKLIILRDFGLNSIYSIFDSNSLGFSNESDFMKALKCFGIKTTKEEVILLFKHYSKDYNKRLSYSEISKIFLPYLENNAISSQELEPETKKKIKNLLEKHLKNEASIEKYRQQMNKKVSPEEIFKNLRCENIGEVLLQKILSLDLGRVLNEKEIYWIFDTFKSSDSLISLKNFREELLPKSRKKY